MSLPYKTNGLVLRRRAYRETDRLVTVLTPDFGKLDLIARGSSKIKSKLAAHLEPYCYSQLMTVAASTVRKRFNSFSQTIIKKAWADYIVEIIDHLVKVKQPDRGLFRLLFNTWLALDQQTMRTPREYMSCFNIVASFIFKLLIHLGYQAEVGLCSDCGRRLDPGKANAIDYRHGSIICYRCDSQDYKKAYVEKISKNTLKLIKYLQQETYAKTKILTARTNELSDLKNVIDKLLAGHIDKKLKTLDFLKYLSHKNKMPAGS